mmetsp:Transcript_71169/g.189238  ORF Transcript_71169/g.189238 Transcript_71169/m.189238 type:complete len:374 (+) Transcript_71169:281-1402(+)
MALRGDGERGLGAHARGAGGQRPQAPLAARAPAERRAPGPRLEAGAALLPQPRLGAAPVQGRLHAGRHELGVPSRRLLHVPVPGRALVGVDRAGVGRGLDRRHVCGVGSGIWNRILHLCRGVGVGLDQLPAMLRSAGPVGGLRRLHLLGRRLPPERRAERGAAAARVDAAQLGRCLRGPLLRAPPLGHLPGSAHRVWLLRDHALTVPGRVQVPEHAQHLRGWYRGWSQRHAHWWAPGVCARMALWLEHHHGQRLRPEHQRHPHLRHRRLRPPAPREARAARRGVRARGRPRRPPRLRPRGPPALGDVRPPGLGRAGSAVTPPWRRQRGGRRAARRLGRTDGAGCGSSVCRGEPPQSEGTPRRPSLIAAQAALA